jgi:hypothetical protein
MAADKGGRPRNEQAQHDRKSQEFHRSPPDGIISVACGKVCYGLGGSKIGFRQQHGVVAANAPCLLTGLE